MVPHTSFLNSISKGFSFKFQPNVSFVGVQVYKVYPFISQFLFTFNLSIFDFVIVICVWESVYDVMPTMLSYGHVNNPYL